MTDHALIAHAEITDQAVAVRAELKVWEKEFASTHGGRKAGRDDIKQNPDIGKEGLRAYKMEVLLPNAIESHSCS